MVMERRFSAKGKLSRRQVLVAGGAVAVAQVALSRPALLQTRRKVKFVYGGGAIDSSDEGFFSSIPLGIGYFADEGLDVEVFAVNGSSTAVNLLATGQVQFTTQSNGGLFAGVGRGIPMTAFICQIPDNYFALAVLEDGPTKSIDQLRGKTIGVPSVGGGTFVMMKAVAHQLGWSDKDIHYIAVGGGLPALDALQRDRVQGLFLWSSPFAIFEAYGAKLRYFQPDPLPQTGFTQTTNTSLQILKDDPSLVAAMSRALAKSLVFMAGAEPDELAKLHFKIFPATKSPGLSDAEILRIDRFRYFKQVNYMRFPQRVFQRTEKLGDCDDRVIEKTRDLLVEAGEIKNSQPPGRYLTRKYLAEMNNIDFIGILARAKAFRA